MPFHPQSPHPEPFHPGPPPFRPEPEPFHPQPEPFHPDPRPFHPQPPPFWPLPEPEPVVIPIPVPEPEPVEPSNWVQVETNIAMVFAWRDGVNGAPQPPGIYFLPPDVADAYVKQGWATLV